VVAKKSVPGLRLCQESAYRVIGLLCAWLWFGNSGLALGVLWLVATRQRHGCQRSVDHWSALVESEMLSFVHMAPHRVLFVVRGAGRVEIFRDEVTQSDWARLRRSCLVGRSAQ